MDEKTIKELLRRGYMVTPGTLKRIEEVGVDAFFSENSVTGTFLKEMKREEPQKTELKTTIRKPSTKATLNTMDVVKNYTNRYNSLKNMLSGKIEAVSINKAGSQFETAVIGMVRQISPQGFSIEDPTGSIDVMSRHGVDLDDVVGVKGIVREGVIQEREIIYPDIPLNRQAFTMDARLPLSVKTEKDSVILVGEKQPQKESLDSLVWISLEKGEKRIHILVYKSPKETDPNSAAKYLKKRHLYPTIKQITSPEDPHIIDPVPDFFWIIGKSRWKSIYKGVVVFSTTGNDRVEINLSTRELIFP
jgi:DNA polymerase II small subunit/DNA polymerase delta subunit B